MQKHAMTTFSLEDVNLKTRKFGFGVSVMSRGGASKMDFISSLYPQYNYNAHHYNAVSR